MLFSTQVEVELKLELKLELNLELKLKLVTTSPVGGGWLVGGWVD